MFNCGFTFGHWVRQGSTQISEIEQLIVICLHMTHSLTLKQFVIDDSFLQKLQKIILLTKKYVGI